MTQVADTLIDFFRYGPIILEGPLTEKEFTDFYNRHPNFIMELEADGKVTIMSPVTKGSGERESIIGGYLFMWYVKNGKKGRVFSPSTGIRLPNGAVKCPDAAWVSEERLKNDTTAKESEYLTVIPNFIVEVRSFTDRIKKLQKKMEEVWMANGVELGWLIDPYKEQVWIYRAGEATEKIEGFDDTVLNGGDLMQGLTLPLEEMKVA